MRRIYALLLGVLLSNLKVNAQVNYEVFKEYSAVYVPDENITYFMEKIKVEPTEDGEKIIFEGLVGKLEGDYSKIILASHPDWKPTVKFNMKRKVLKSSVNTNYGVTCVNDGILSVILFPKKIVDEE